MRMKMLNSFKNDFILDKNRAHDIERRIDEKYCIASDTKMKEIILDKIMSRKEMFFYEKDYNRPQCIFYIYIKKLNTTIFGRKMISPLYKKNMISSMNCSMITENMIVGILNNGAKNGRDIVISYFPLTDGERLNMFNIIKNDSMINIEYPFVYCDYYTQHELGSPVDGWKIHDNTELNLFNGEEHLRLYTIKILNKIGVENKSVLFDPACSTGDFLYEMKKNFPRVVTIGQDLSHEMATISKKKIDIVYCGDSIFTPVLDDSVDFLFFRFLNSKVVTTDKAKELYNVLIKKVKIGGYIICFGHTPVLLNLDFMIKSGWELISSSGYNKKYDSIFQYYVLRRQF